VTFELVLSHLRKRDFAVLSTVGEGSKPHSAGVSYGVSRPGRDVVIYVMTRKHLQKARNIAQNPNVSLVIPLARRFLWFLPPPTIQLQGRAEIVDWTDEEGTDVFRRFWMGRQILRAYQESHRRGETRICFLKITPDPVVRTYMLGYRIWELRKRMESGAAKVVNPTESRSSAPPSSPEVGMPPCPVGRTVFDRVAIRRPPGWGVRRQAVLARRPFGGCRARAANVATPARAGSWPCACTRARSN
jgi:general stress protein 26